MLERDFEHIEEIGDSHASINLDTPLRADAFDISDEEKIKKIAHHFSEIMQTMGVTRTTILSARRTGKLPDPIDIQGKIFIWERDKVTPYLDAWKIVLDARRGAVA